jgi:hypothetical protein
MTRLLFSGLAGPCVAALCTPAAQAHPGGYDRNAGHYEDGRGNRYHCHREPRPNTDAGAVAKKSRDNVCRDSSSPNYRQLKYFISYRSMKDCLASGGREPQ